MELWKQSEIEEIKTKYFGRAAVTGDTILHPVTGKFGLLKEYPDGDCEVVDPDGNGMRIKLLNDTSSLDDQDKE